SGRRSLRIADFRKLAATCPFIAFMPQWDFLNFVAEQGRRFAGFDLRMQAEVTRLIEEGGRVVGVEARTPAGPLFVRAGLVIGAAGRHSTVRDRAGLPVEVLGAPMDVAWFALPRQPSDPETPGLRLGAGEILVTLNRGEQWQCGYVIAKGSFD